MLYTDKNLEKKHEDNEENKVNKVTLNFVFIFITLLEIINNKKSKTEIEISIHKPEYIEILNNIFIH